MIAWCHLPTIFNRRLGLRTVGLALLCAVITTTALVAHAQAVPGNQTINFQGRLQTAAGAVVPDGHYNMQFKIYENGSGSAAGNPGGTLKWTESYINNGSTAGIEVRNGFFSVSLGSVTPFSGNVDWNSGDLWLSMNIAGSASACTSFGTSPCASDGEMLPMKQITASPFALNAAALGGKTAGNFTQLGQGVQTDNSTNSSIFINKTNTGNLLQLQASGSDALTINSTGSITLGSTTNQSISLAPAAAGSGKELTLAAGDAAPGGDFTGGNLVLQAGSSSGAALGGSVIVQAAGQNSLSAFQVQNATGTPILNVDSINGIVSVGSLNFSSSDLIIAGQTSSLWGTEAISASSYTDNSALNFGMTFKSDVSGQITGVRYYNHAGNNSNGTDIGKLWACNSPTCALNEGGTQLASVLFPADDSAGWKTATLSSPVAISPNTYYMVTYYNQNGSYYATSHYFDNDYHATPLHAPGINTLSNGSFTAGSADFPTNTFNATNYWVDVVFEATTSVDQVSSSNGLILSSGGAMTLGPTSQELNLQGNGINISASNDSAVTIQGASVTRATFNDANIQIGSGTGTGQPVLLTLDRAGAAPTITNHDAMLGSMYYDTTLGKLQCYEAEGWGNCGTTPDTFITLNPEYTNAVTNGNGIGTMTSDLCSDTLNINDGSSGQPTVCGTNETHNFYDWTSSQGSAQTKSIYVTYQLPSTFKQFVSNATSLTGRTDSTSATVSYQIYRNAGTGLTACGSTISVSTGSQSAWQKAVASGGNDPSGCAFEAGDSIVVKINFTASANAHAYVSTLGLTYSNQ